MTFLFLCILIPTLVFGLNNTNSTNNEERYEELSIINASLVGNTTMELNTNLKEIINGQISQNTRTTESVPLINASEVTIPNKPKLHQHTKKSKKSVKQKSNSMVTKPLKPLKRDLADMPTTSDLDEIMGALHKVLDYFLENKNDVDLSMAYGLFLVNVNLRVAFKDKRQVLPSGLSFSLKHLLEKNEELLGYFKKMVAHDTFQEDEAAKSLVTLFNNEQLWMHRIQKFDGSHVNKTVHIDIEDLETRYSYWERYLEKVGDYNLARPRPEQSNKCLSFLARNPTNRTPWKKYCQIPEKCREPLEKGTNFGYGLTHRLLYLQFAYYSHRCYVFSNKEDKDMRDQFCKWLYSEATFITKNDYGILDLFVEQLCLCALDGHYEFLRRSWLLSILGFQTSEGCFSEKPPENKPQSQLEIEMTDRIWHLDNGEHEEILGGQCNVHTSSAAAATLAFGVKFILEAYY